MLSRLSLSTKQLLHSQFNTKFNTIVRIVQKMEPNHPGLFSKAHLPSQLIANNTNNSKSELYNTPYFEKESRSTCSNSPPSPPIRSAVRLAQEYEEVIDGNRQPIKNTKRTPMTDDDLGVQHYIDQHYQEWKAK